MLSQFGVFARFEAHSNTQAAYQHDRKLPGHSELWSFKLTFAVVSRSGLAETCEEYQNMVKAMSQIAICWLILILAVSSPRFRDNFTPIYIV